jgi:hypothetical protein
MKQMAVRKIEHVGIMVRSRELSKEGRVHHVAFTVDDIEQLEFFESTRGGPN